MKLDFEELILEITSQWWGEKHMRQMVWNSILTCRTTLNRCGYSTESTEYQDLTFLLALHNELWRR